jgi:GWxTD domain-containing protein
MRASLRTILFVALVSLAAAPAARAQDVPGPSPREGGGFELLLNQDYDAAGQSILVAGVAVPYRRLVFFLRSGRYEARYRVYLELYDEGGARLRGEVWEETVATNVFRETTSGASVARSSKRFTLPPGVYRAKATVEVIDTSRRFTKEETIRVVGGAARRLDLSEPAYQSLRGDSATVKPPPGEIRAYLCPPDTAGIGRQGSVFGSIDAFARVRYALVVPAGADGRIVLSTRVRDAAGTVVRYRRSVLSGAGAGRATVCLDMNVDDWRLGLYTIETVVEAPGISQRRESGGRFTLLLNRGLFGVRVDDIEAILGAVAGADEIAAITGAPLAERFDAWAAFWRKRDPTPSTAGNEAFGEFMARLRTVIERFSRTEPGWRADQGRIYLADGPPDKIETRSDVGTRGYELWYYYAKGIVYIFEDLIGSGDYRLLMTRML